MLHAHLCPHCLRLHCIRHLPDPTHPPTIAPGFTLRGPDCAASKTPSFFPLRHRFLSSELLSPHITTVSELLSCTPTNGSLRTTQFLTSTSITCLKFLLSCPSSIE
ncbi:hypothetical protein MLD38_026339 [Melastoma candidum]|uniref:Uncharacterized protein n=1 Tax=Melastoma candidum TaxID=119954 RepID=A0ACB9P3E3_9MYRT|nr:hypothetical protein MLD38_026339 [Melastoma candidum]